MHASVRTRYAIKAVLRLAIGWGGPPVQAREVARFGGIPPKFLDQVMADLRHAGLVISRRGKGGGYLLARDPRQISFADVFEAIEGSWGGLARMPGGDPAETLVEPVWCEVRRTTREVLSGASFADIAAQADDSVGMYYI